MCGESREKRTGRRSARLLVGSVDSRRRFSSRTPRLGTRVFRIKNPGTLLHVRCCGKKIQIQIHRTSNLPIFDSDAQFREKKKQEHQIKNTYRIISSFWRARLVANQLNRRKRQIRPKPLRWMDERRNDEQ